MEHLATSGFFREVLVWTNTVGSNCMVYGRYLAAARASFDIVYTQDDDCMVENIGELLDLFDGERLICAMKPDSLERYSCKEYGGGRIALLGWGAVFRREWLAVLDRYVARFGQDALLRREADRIFTMLLDRPYRAIETRIRPFPCAAGPHALWRDPQHSAYLEEAVKRTLPLLQPGGRASRLPEIGGACP